ncbi:uncharacterized protein LOC112575979 [Pomacea canaliculata]|uniref:uncharacterized protein LOC112575979 n=1 Tax=Pomacea canaliculata TaxID=400727 RepID=UPI000D73D4BE|nr:uncharacterized protein LOC112575979 [Pomacea canaliculata]
MGRLSFKTYDYIMGCLSSKVGPDAETNPDSVPNENESSVMQSCAGRNTPQMEKDHNIIRGDITRKYEARKAREETLRKKQLRITSAAEDLSHRIMEERDRLSLRSHTVSRATSRTGSPSQQKKHVTFSTISATTISTADSDKSAIKKTPTK